MKYLFGLGIILIIILTSVTTNSCCTFCKIQTDTIHSIDTLYYPDSIPFFIEPEIDVNVGGIQLYLDSIGTLMDLLKENPDTIIDIKYYPIKLTSDTVSAETEYAYAESYIVNNELRLELEQKDSLIMVVGDSLRSVVTNKETIIKEKLGVNRKLVRQNKLFKLVVWVLLGIVLIFVLKFALYKR